MKKHFYCIFIFIMGLSVFSGCQKQTLPVPEYPLDAATVAAALQEAELLWTIEEEDSWFDGQTVYTLNKDGEMVAAVSSAMKNDERFLFISFAPYHNNEHSLPEEEWESAIIFATLLYGSFESPRQIYNHFTSDYGIKNTVKEPRERIMGGSLGHEEASMWDIEINGINCWMLLERPYLSMPQECLGAIRLTSDLDTFNF